MGILRTLTLRDNADTILSVRWVNAQGQPQELTSVLSQVRETFDSDVLVEAIVTLEGAPEHWAILRFRAEDVAAADFESLAASAVWDAVATRAADGAKATVAEGSVSWSRGCSR